MATIYLKANAVRKNWVFKFGQVQNVYCIINTSKTNHNSLKRNVHHQENDVIHDSKRFKKPPQLPLQLIQF